jgi:hypothetical protein
VLARQHGRIEERARVGSSASNEDGFVCTSEVHGFHPLPPDTITGGLRQSVALEGLLLPNLKRACSEGIFGVALCCRVLHRACDLRCWRTLQHEVDPSDWPVPSGLIHFRYMGASMGSRRESDTRR